MLTKFLLKRLLGNTICWVYLKKPQSVCCIWSQPKGREVMSKYMLTWLTLLDFMIFNVISYYYLKWQNRIQVNCACSWIAKFLCVWCLLTLWSKLERDTCVVFAVSFYSFSSQFSLCWKYKQRKIQEYVSTMYRMAQEFTCFCM